MDCDLSDVRRNASDKNHRQPAGSENVVKRLMNNVDLLIYVEVLHKTNHLLLFYYVNMQTRAITSCSFTHHKL